MTKPVVSRQAASIEQSWPTCEFTYPALERVLFGRGQSVSRLPDLLAEMGIRRPLIVTGKTLATSTPLVGQLLEALGGRTRPVGVFSGSQAHTPSSSVTACADVAASNRADCLVVLGGSSAVDTAKGAVLALAHGRGWGEQQIDTNSWLVEPAALDVPKLPIVCIPTTLSGSEFTASLGVTIEHTRVKTTYRHRTLAPRVVVLDADVTVATPELLWASTALKLVDHGVERMLSKSHQPLIDIQAIVGIRMIRHRLADSIPLGDEVADRREPILGALWLIQNNHGNVGSGLSHSLAHQFGARNGVPHGYGSALFLVPTLRYNLATARDRYRLLAEAFDIEPESPAAPEAVIERLDELVDELGLPRKLRDVGVRQSDLRPVAEATLAERGGATNPLQPKTVEGLVAFLEAIW
jgi:maleylacetate reductase